MKKLLILVLALGMLGAPVSFAADTAANTSASADDLSGVNITDYLVFEPGTWWTYQSVSEDLINRTDSEALSTTTQVECEDPDQDVCYSNDDADGVTSIYIEDNVSYFSMIDGEALAEDYTQTNLDGYSEELNARDYATFGFGDAEGTLTITCDYSMDESYSFQGELTPALVEDCAATTTVQSLAFEVETRSIQVKGYGIVESNSHYYVASVPAYEITTELVDSSLIQASPFSDVELTDKNYAAIDYLHEEGVFNGYDDGTFRPNNTLNRAELLKSLIEGLNITPDENLYKDCFLDVASDWYAKYVCYAKEQGWVEGYSDGNFKPGQTVNKVEALKMLLLSQGIPLVENDSITYSDVSSEDWFQPHVQTAVELGILEEDEQYFFPSSDKDRKGIAENLYRLLLNLEVPTASEAMAQGTCLVFYSSLTPQEVDEQFDDIMSEHSYESSTDIDWFVDRIRDYTSFNLLQTQLATDLETTCGDELATSEIDAEELAAGLIKE